MIDSNFVDSFRRAILRKEKITKALERYTFAATRDLDRAKLAGSALQIKVAEKRHREITSTVSEIQDLASEIESGESADFLQQLIYGEEEEKQMREAAKQEMIKGREDLLRQLEEFYPNLSTKTSENQQTGKGKGRFKHFSLQPPKKIPRGWIQE